MSTIYESTKDNNLRTNPEIMNVGDTFIGKLNKANDVDCIKVIFPKRGWISFELDIPANTDYRIRVYTNDNDRDNVAAQDIRLGSLGQMRSCTARVDNISDVYYICISVNTSSRVNTTAAYTLRVFYHTNPNVKNYIENKISIFDINKRFAVGYVGNKYWNKGSVGTQDTLDGWGLTENSVGYDTVYGNARQCAGFSFFLAYKIFGSNISMQNSVVSVPSTWKKITSDYTNIQLKPGDIIRKGGHSAMIYTIEKNSSGAEVANVLECLGSVANLVRYGGYNGHTDAQTTSGLLSGSLEYVLIAPIN